MSQLLILGTAILAVGPVNDSGDDVVTPEVIYPKVTIPGYAIVEADLPSNFIPSEYEWIGGALQPKSPPIPSGNAYGDAEAVTQSYNASLQREAEKLQSEGKTFEAVQLLLKAQGVQQ